MTEFKPMLLSEHFYKDGIFDQYDGWIAQIKENGVYAVIHVKNHKIVGIRNRENNPIFHLYPELENIQFQFNEAMLIAEICVFKDGKSVFYGGIDQRRTRKHDKNHAVTAIIHDILKIDGRIVITQPYIQRYAIIKEKVANHGFIRVAECFNPKELWSLVIKRDLEGLVLKNPKACYQIGVRSNDYIKVKNYKFVEVIVDDVEENPKGVKIIGRSDVNGENIEVECQLGGVFNAVKGQKVPIKYLDIVGKRLIQPTKWNTEK